MISADIVLDSVSPHGHRLTTFKLRYPRFVHAEFLTHRVFSRNSSSSRAVPARKRIEEAKFTDLQARPEHWGRDQGGMAADGELEGHDLHQAQAAWQAAADAAVRYAKMMMAAGAHKQIVNRILEPFTHIDVVVTATEYMNFFGLRLDLGAQPEMRLLAEAMWTEYSRSVPNTLKPGEWHMPFFHQEDLMALGYVNDPNLQKLAIRVSVARCARVSYVSHATGRRSTVEEDLKLYDRLVGSTPLHASPAEHQATPDGWLPNPVFPGHPEAATAEPGWGPNYVNLWANPGEHKNFTGWRQYRAMLPGESLAPLPAGYTTELEGR